MRRPLSRLPAVAYLIGVSAAMQSGCAVPDGGYAYGGGPAVNYYEPYGYGYGGWGTGFFVAPYHDGDHRFDYNHRVDRDADVAHGTHAFRAATPGRGVPSLPAGGRGSGGHAGGGGHGGGEGHGGR